VYETLNCVAQWRLAWTIVFFFISTDTSSPFVLYFTVCCSLALGLPCFFLCVTEGFFFLQCINSLVRFFFWILHKRTQTHTPSHTPQKKKGAAATYLTSLCCCVVFLCRQRDRLNQVASFFLSLKAKQHVFSLFVWKCSARTRRERTQKKRLDRSNTRRSVADTRGSCTAERFKK
jgi:hypothetical protein